MLDFAHEVAERRSHPKLRDKEVALPLGVDAAAFFASARQAVAKEARGLTAPLKCVDAVEAAVQRRFEDGMQFERQIFVELVTSTESRALRHAFFAERAAAKIPDLPEDTRTRPIRTVAVLGFGTMGGGIAMSFANAGIPVTVYEREQAALDRGMALCRTTWGAAVKKGRMTLDQVDKRLALLRRRSSSRWSTTPTS